MAGIQPPSGGSPLYRFLQPDETEVEQRQLLDDDAAEEHARDLSKARQTPITIERRDDVDWEYVTEADERS
jgi:hypothetical protein